MALYRCFQKIRPARACPAATASQPRPLQRRCGTCCPPLGAVLAVLAVIIAVSRVVTGVHFVSDVLAGLAFGLVFAVAGRAAYIAAASALGFYAIMVI